MAASSSEISTHYRTCNLCEAMCGLEIQHQNEKIISIKADKQDVLSHGHICPKAIALQDLHEDKDRVRLPLKRTAAGWVEISWDEALNDTAEKIKHIQTRHGRDAVAIYLGNPSAHNHGALLTLPLLLAALKTKNRFSATSVDQLPHMLACLKMFGHQALFPIPDIDRTDYFLCLGGNPVASGGSIMSAPGFKERIKSLQARNGKFILIDPRHTESAEFADQHFFIRPGTDALFLAALINVLFTEKKVALKHLADISDGLETLEHLISPFTPEAVEQHTQIAAADIRAIALAFSNAKTAVAYGRMGISTQANSTVSCWLVYVLNVITGNLDAPGGAMFSRPAIDVVGLTGLAGEAGSFDTFRSRVSQYPEFGGELPAACLAEEITTAGSGQIKALITHAGNPVISTPNGTQLETALGQLDFMVAIDFYITETTKHAHIILPPTGPLEHGHYDVALYAVAVRNVAKFSPPLFQPQPGMKQDWEIISDLSSRINSKDFISSVTAQLTLRLINSLRDEGILDVLMRIGPYGSGTNIALHIDQILMKNGLSQVIWKPIKNILNNLIEKISALSSVIPYEVEKQEKPLTLEIVKQSPHGIDLGPLQACLPERLYTANKKIQLTDSLFINQLANVKKQLESAPSEDLLLIGRRHVRSNNSWLHNSHRLVKGKSRCTLMLHPKDADQHSIADGALVKVSTRVGSIELAAEITDKIMPGVISIPHGWGHHRDDIRWEIAAEHAGVSVNDITDEKLLDSGTGVAILNGIPVQIAAI